MYAIARCGGKQFKIQSEGVIRVPSLSSEVGEKLKLEEILLVSDGDSIKVGTPLVDGAYAEVTVVRHGRDKKIKIIKYKRRKGYKRTLGHRQGFTELEIGKIVLDAQKQVKSEKPSEAKASVAAKEAPAKKATAEKAVKAEKPAAARKPAATAKKADKDAKAPAKSARKPAAAKKPASAAKKADAADKDAKAKKPAAAKAAKKPAARKPAEKAGKKAEESGGADKG